MKEALLHLDNAINVLGRSAGAHAAIISTLEGVRASLMNNIFGVSLAPEQYHTTVTNSPKRDWTLGPDEPVPHNGVECVSMSQVPRIWDRRGSWSAGRSVMIDGADDEEIGDGRSKGR
jgi:hypothetical protein